MNGAPTFDATMTDIFGMPGFDCYVRFARPLNHVAPPADAIIPEPSPADNSNPHRPREIMMDLGRRLVRHARLSWQSLALPDVPSPPFLILFINSICNMRCEHCFYWQQLNQRDDLSFDELVALSEELGPVENLNLS